MSVLNGESSLVLFENIDSANSITVALAYALVKERNFDVSMLLMQQLPHIDVSQTFAGESFVHLATKNSSTENLAMLLQENFPISLADSNGDLPIHRALKNHHMDAATLLWRKTQDAQNSDLTLEQLLIQENHDGNTLLHLLADVAVPPAENCQRQQKLMALFHEVLPHITNLFTRNHQGLPAIVIAAKRGHLEMVRALFLLGVSPKLVDAKGKSLLSYAIEAKQWAVVTELFTWGAGIDDKLPALLPQEMPKSNADWLICNLYSGNRLVDKQNHAFTNACFSLEQFRVYIESLYQGTSPENESTHRKLALAKLQHLWLIISQKHFLNLADKHYAQCYETMLMRQGQSLRWLCFSAILSAYQDHSIPFLTFLQQYHPEYFIANVNGFELAPHSEIMLNDLLLTASLFESTANPQSLAQYQQPLSDFAQSFHLSWILYLSLFILCASIICVLIFVILFAPLPAILIPDGAALLASFGGEGILAGLTMLLLSLFSTTTCDELPQKMKTDIITSLSHPYYDAIEQTLKNTIIHKLTSQVSVTSLLTDLQNIQKQADAYHLDHQKHLDAFQKLSPLVDIHAAIKIARPKTHLTSSPSQALESHGIFSTKASNANQWHQKNDQICKSTSQDCRLQY